MRNISEIRSTISMTKKIIDMLEIEIKNSLIKKDKVLHFGVLVALDESEKEAESIRRDIVSEVYKELFQAGYNCGIIKGSGNNIVEFDIEL